MLSSWIVPETISSGEEEFWKARGGWRDVVCPGMFPERNTKSSHKPVSGTTPTLVFGNVYLVYLFSPVVQVWV